MPLTSLSAAGAPTRETAEPDDPSENARAVDVRAADRLVAYKRTPQGDLRLHVYLPKDWRASDRRPAILFFHGGGWTGGKPDQFFHHAEHFAGRGMVAASAEYRVLKVHGTLPEKCSMDSRSAMRFLRSRAAEWGVDPGRILAGGSSAGAHLACALALRCGFDEPGEETSVPFRPAAVLAWGNCPDTAGKGFRWKGTPEEAKGDAYALALSPLHHVAPGCPPILMFSGGADVYVPSVRAFAEKMLAAGNRTEFHTAPGGSHGFHANPSWLRATTLLADRWLVSLGYLNGEPTTKPADPKAVLVKELPK